MPGDDMCGINRRRGGLTVGAHEPARAQQGAPEIPGDDGDDEGQIMTGDDIEDRSARSAGRFPVIAEALSARIGVEDERRTMVAGLRVLGPGGGDDGTGRGLIRGGGEPGEEKGIS